MDGDEFEYQLSSTGESILDSAMDVLMFHFLVKVVFVVLVS